MSSDHARLMHGVIPYLAIADAGKAIKFYAEAFGAEVFGEPAMMPGTDKIANASLVINGGVLMLSDHFPEHGQPAAKGGLGYTMQLVVADGDVWWKRAVDAGCEITMPFTQQFWGDRFGALRDPFGIDWAINEPSPESMAKTRELS
jgi:PhnB protein